MKRWAAIAGFMAVLGVLLGGCTEQASSTEFGADDSVLKVLTIRENSMASMGGMMGNEEGLSLADKIEFLGEGWTVTEDSDDEGLFIRAEKKFSNWADAEAEWRLRISDEAAVVGKTSISESDGYFHFEEKYSIDGETDPAAMEKAIEGLSEALRETWIKGELSDADAERLAVGVSNKSTRIVFGPNEPILTLMFSTPQRFAREFRIRAFAEIAPLFVGVNGMTMEEARDQTKALLGVWQGGPDMDTNPAMPTDDEEGSEEPQKESYAITVSFKGPVVKEHNGRLDPTTDEVFWDFYSQTLEVEPVSCMVRFRK